MELLKSFFKDNTKYFGLVLDLLYLKVLLMSIFVSVDLMSILME